MRNESADKLGLILLCRDSRFARPVLSARCFACALAPGSYWRRRHCRIACQESAIGCAAAWLYAPVAPIDHCGFPSRLPFDLLRCRPWNPPIPAYRLSAIWLLFSKVCAMPERYSPAGLHKTDRGFSAVVPLERCIHRPFVDAITWNLLLSCRSSLRRCSGVPRSVRYRLPLTYVLAVGTLYQLWFALPWRIHRIRVTARSLLGFTH